MSAILALLPGIITLIPSITSGVESIIALITAIRAAAKQDNVWTAELETAFLNALLATRTDPAWQPDPKPAPLPPSPIPDPQPPTPLPPSA